MAERDANGRFVKGSIGNPTGRLPRQREERYYQILMTACTFEDWKRIILKAVQQAIRGDTQARKWIADYVVGTAIEHKESLTDDLLSSSNLILPADAIAPSFVNVYRDIRDRKHTEYLFFGGRGSTKSSFVSLITVYLLVNNPEIHALACRQVGNTLRDSVFSQLQWAIGELGLSDKFKCTTSPLEIEYLPTKQKIYFREIGRAHV
jgi:hypothetical protein